MIFVVKLYLTLQQNQIPTSVSEAINHLIKLQQNRQTINQRRTNNRLWRNLNKKCCAVKTSPWFKAFIHGLPNLGDQQKMCICMYEWEDDFIYIRFLLSYTPCTCLHALQRQQATRIFQHYNFTFCLFISKFFTTVLHISSIKSLLKWYISYHISVN